MNEVARRKLDDSPLCFFGQKSLIKLELNCNEIAGVLATLKCNCYLDPCSIVNLIQLRAVLSREKKKRAVLHLFPAIHRHLA